MKLNTNLLKKAHLAAVKARKNAYMPYSKYKVGAAVVTKSGRIFAGCNVENASYGATICAERVAIGSAIAAGAGNIIGVVVVTDSKPLASPCGVCRQVLSEFLPRSGWIAIASPKRIESIYSIDELLPLSFSSKSL